MITRIPFAPAVMHAALVLVLFIGVTRSATAQSGGIYDLSWNRIASGGGVSGGGVFALEGTVGQADAGSLSGGIYQLDGGFWWAESWVVGVPEAPTLSPAAVLSLKGLTSNPTPRTRLEVAFSLTNSEPAEIMLLDVSGRLLVRVPLDGFAPGPHVMTLTPSRGLMPGVYWLQLRQGGERRVVKAVVL